MFQVKLTAIKQSKSYLTDGSNNIATSWHRKLGHISNENMKTLLKISDGINLTSKNLTELEMVCEICQKAKQTRTKFENARIKAKRYNLQIIHSDVCGPITPSTWDGNRYFITFLDDFTHYSMVFLIKNKEEVTSKIKEYIEKVEARWNLRVSKLRCDNGRKYINKNVTTWCESKGIELNRTVIHHNSTEKLRDSIEL